MNDVFQATLQIFKGFYNLLMAITSLLIALVGKVGYGIYRLFGGKPKPVENTLPPQAEPKPKMRIKLPIFGQHRCPHCNRTLDAKAHDDLCPHCYGDLARICPGCSETVSIKKRTCPHCKTYLPKL